MTVEERASRAWAVRPIGCNADYEAIVGWLKGVLCDQIEECAKKAEAAIVEVPARNSQTILYRDYIEHNNALLEQLAYDIRALAADPIPPRVRRALEGLGEMEGG